MCLRTLLLTPMLLVLVVCHPVAAGLCTREAMLVPTGGSPKGYFGLSLAMDGDTVVVGDIADSTAAHSAGAGYVFVRSAGSWVLQAKLMASNAGSSDHLGIAAAVSGDTIVLGAGFPINFEPHTGAAYVFERTGGIWTETAILVPSDGEYEDMFGRAVHVDGDTIVVGAIRDDNERGLDAGAAYVYVREGGAWVEQAKLVGSAITPEAQFGKAVAVQGDTVVVGADRDSPHGFRSGAAYVYRRTGESWQEETIFPGWGADYLGYSLSLRDDTLLVGAPGRSVLGPGDGAAFVFERVEAEWREQAMLTSCHPIEQIGGDGYGQAVALGNDFAFVAARMHSDVGPGVYKGAVFVYARQEENWVGQQEISHLEFEHPGQIGGSLAASGNRLVIGDAWYWTEAGETGAAFVYSCAPGIISGPGEVSAPGSGSPLQVVGTRDELVLTFEDMGPGMRFYNLYGGQIGNWYSHWRWECEIEPASPSAGRLEAPVRPIRTNSYFLVTVTGGCQEGSAGRSSASARPQGTHMHCEP